MLKESAFETTQRVFFVGENGVETGPYVRNLIQADSGVGQTYERLWVAQQAGARFLSLPHIVECYEAGEQNVVVMEYVSGETLEQSVSTHGASMAFAQEIFSQLRDAVSELHDRFNPPIIHRDLTPTNIMLSSGGVTIIDFGIACTYKDGAAGDTQHFATRAWASPEQQCKLGFIGRRRAI